jgi:hypothetical protein
MFGCTVNLMGAIKAIAKPPTPGATQTITGCLQQSLTTTAFRLNDVQGGRNKQVTIDGGASSADLRAHLGHRVEIAGAWVDASISSKAQVADKVAAAPRFRVLSVKMLSTKCS